MSKQQKIIDLYSERCVVRNRPPKSPHPPSEKSTRQIIPRNAAQKRYLEEIESREMIFGIGPAGTGKTYLAVFSAVKALNSHKVERIILARPAIETGEKLGFLPGSLQEKIDPYMRPLYDALNDMIEPAKLDWLLDKQIIEIAPLAFMRGRTLNDSFIILDEAQNTTSEQMKMFLTRMGYGSKIVINGDITQIDLPPEKESGLVEALKFLQDVPGIGIFEFSTQDVVRHNLVQKVINAYNKA